MKSFPPLPTEDLQHILTRTASLWEEARGKSFFITGGTGFFGIWLLESFNHINEALGLNARATVLTRNPIAFTSKAPHLAQFPNLHFLQGDICDFPFPQATFDYVIHAATEASTKLNAEAPHEMLDSIIIGMKRILKFTTQANVRKFLFTSSGAVYGPQPAELTHFPEDYLGAPHCLNPTSAYGEGKRVAELMIAIHSKQLSCEFKIARCFAFVGPHLPLNAHFAVGNFIRDALAQRTITIRGDGASCRSYLYAADLAVWLWTLLFTGTPLRAYNVGSSQPISIQDLASLVKNTLNSSLSIEILNPAAQSRTSSSYIPSIDRAAAELNLRPSTSLPEAIQKTAKWYLLAQDL